jgi:hypothetical protein
MAIWHDQYNLFSSLFFMLFQRFITTDVEIGGFFKQGKEEAGKQNIRVSKMRRIAGCPPTQTDNLHLAVILASARLRKRTLADNLDV